MRYKGAVFFDIDGTLIDERTEIFEPTENVKNAINRLKRNGYLTGIATGRGRRYMPDLGIDFECYVTYNGAITEINGREIYCEYFPQDDVREIVEILERAGAGYALENSKNSYYKNAYAGQAEAVLDAYRVRHESFVPIGEKKNIPTNKIMVYAENKQLEEIKKVLKDGYEVVSQHQGIVSDIISKSISKASGIERAAEYTGISAEDIYAFGDDGNDYLMLKKAGHGIAMTPHAEILEEAADGFALSVKEDGVYHSLKDLGLIE